MLNEAETERHRRRGLDGRILVRHLLSRYADEAPADWCFEIGRHGKPELVEPSSPLHFNLSHSEDWLAVAVSRSAQVGVDVQLMDPERRIERLARRYFSLRELQDLEALEDDALRTHFYRLWSLKEAWTKARGEALPGALGGTGFALEGERLVSLDPIQTAGCGFWLLQLEAYSLAVCGVSEGLSLRCFEWRATADVVAREPAIIASSGVS